MEQWFTLQTLIWLFPIAFILHDFEEIITIEKWMKKEEILYARLPVRIARRVIRNFSMTTAQFAVAVLVIFLFVSTSTYMASQFINHGPLGNLAFFVVCTLVFFVHAFTHLAQSIFLRAITPGAITSLIIVIPYSLLLFDSLFTNEIITWTTIISSLPYLLFVIPIVLLAHWIGKRVV